MKENYYELAEKAKELYFKENNVKKVAKLLECSISKARKLLILAGVNFSKRHAEILELYNRGLSLKEISEKTGLAISSVNDYLPYKEAIINKEKQTKRTRQNQLAKLRKEALKNKNDIKGILFAYAGCRGFNYIYLEDGIIIDGFKYLFDSFEAKKMVDKIIEKKAKNISN